jgi:hypothetical protein
MQPRNVQTVTTSPRPGSDAERSSRVAYACAIAIGVALAYFLIRMPYQISDDLEHMLIAQSQSWWDILVTRYATVESMRPAMWLTQNAVFELAPGDRYFGTFKAVHVAELVATLVLFVRVLRVRTTVDVVALPLALVVLVGMHTFSVTVREGYPVNHFMTVLLCCLVVTNLADLRPHRWHDVAAVLTCAYALFTIETGIIVWVCLVAVYLAGWRGVSAKGIVGATMIVVAYVLVRFAVLDVGTRTLGVTSSGYGFSVRDTGELATLFGNAPWKFYVYNVACAALTVLFSEPRAGVFQFTQFVVRGNVPAWSLVNLAASTIATILIAFNLIPRLRRWKQWTFERDDVLLLMFVAVLAANSAISYPYLKEVVMSPAGMFYAIALFIAVRDLLYRLRQQSSLFAMWVAVPLLVLSTGWSLRAVTLVQTLRTSAFVNRNDWATAEEREDEVRPQWRSRHPDAERLVRRLRDEVVEMPVPQPFTTPRWTRAWVDPY